jgi:hypothetical protein
LWWILERKLAGIDLRAWTDAGMESKSKDFKKTHAGVKNNFLYPS